jgi:isocitrate dehydrogenase kinase/phosphatase
MLTHRAASIIWEAFAGYRRGIHALMQRAPLHFEAQDWHRLQADALERLYLLDPYITLAVQHIRPLLGERLKEKALWIELKAAYAERCHGQPAGEVAKSFFTSITRRVFGTVGVDAAIEFRGADFDDPSPLNSAHLLAITADSYLELAHACLRYPNFAIEYEDFERDATLVARALEIQWQTAGRGGPSEGIDLLTPVFYRNQGAYLVGRLRGGTQHLPLVIALRNPHGRVVVDAVLTDEDDVSIIFSFTRSYFQVEVEYTRETVLFLKDLLPRKRLAELYISLGYPRHGKTELYRELLQHIEQAEDQFVIAPGEKGMVMIVFVLSSFDIVFKVIRDMFAPPKTTTRQDVLDKYALVFKHDRAGRLVDAQEFRQLAFPRARFAPDLLAELRGATQSMELTETQVIFKHVYVERRMTPLNLYLREQPPAAAQAAVLDYGQAIKDLAATNTFPGDLLLKNFGVTRHGRVIFYDYDELCFVTDCQFRDLPQASDDEDEMRGEPWFYVGDKDIFPEEFLTFIGLQGEQRATFLAAHQDLLTAHYWRQVQARHRAGELFEVLPYRPERRLHKEAS